MKTEIKTTEWPKIVTVDGVARCYFGPFDLVGISCAEFEKVNLSSKQHQDERADWTEDDAELFNSARASLANCSKTTADLEGD